MDRPRAERFNWGWAARRKESPVSKQSSAVVAFRAFIMVAFLVAIPAIALFGTNLPDTLRQLAERHLGISFNGSSSGALTDAPLMAPRANGSLASGDAPADAAPIAPINISIPTDGFTPPANLGGAMAGIPTALPSTAEQSTQATPLSAATPPPPPPAIVAPAQAPPRADGAVVPVGYNAPLTPASAAPAAPAAPPNFKEPQSFNFPGVAAAHPLAAVDQPAPPAAVPPASPAATGPAAEIANTGESLPRIQRRLRELGATYSLLESWGNQGQLYRFYCKMGIGGNSNYTRYFEATDADPLHAMSIVLQQVESWRAGRQ